MKELTTKQKAQRYDEAIERAKKWHNAPNIDKIPTYGNRVIEEIFPELAESENENIRNFISNELACLRATDEKGSDRYEELTNAIAWLEKQGESNSYYWKPSKEQFEALDYAYNSCSDTERGNYYEGVLETLIEDLHRLEKQGEQKPDKQPHSYELEEEIEEWLGCEAFPEGTNITPLPKAMDIVRETANHFYDFGRKQQAIRNIQCTNSQVTTPESYINEGQKKGIQMVLDNPQEYGLQKPVDKVEPKFKVGVWCIDNEDGTIFQIVKVLDNTYTYKTNEGKEYSCSHYSLENDARLWTIQDAKDGDVLATDNGLVFIYNGYLEEQQWPFAYGGINIYGRFNICDGLLPFTHQKIVPATKEQCDTLMKAIKDAGYEWDIEKKELKKIEDEIEIPFGAKDSELQEETYFIPKGFHAEIDDGKVVIKKGEKSATWSEEDEQNYDIILKIICSSNKPENLINELFNWFKSLKNRMQPEQEWNYNDEIIIETIIQEIEKIPSEKFIDNAKYRCLDWLRYRTKFLRPQNNNVTDKELAQAKKDAYNDTLDKIEYHSGEPTFDDGWDAAIWYLKKRNTIPQLQWKPSEKQIKGIECAIKTLQHQLNVRDKRLNSLYDDLKKLREE